MIVFIFLNKTLVVMLMGSTSISRSTLDSYRQDRDSYMSAPVLLYLLNELRKEIKCEGCRAIYLFFATSFINLVKQEHEC